MDGDARRSRLRTFALGGLVGAAGAIVTARRRGLRPAPGRRAAPGLAAFEDAPCFLELMAEAAHRQCGGESETGTS